MFLTEGSNIVFIKSFIIWIYSCYSPIKLSVMVEHVCVLFTPVYFPSSRTQYGRGVKGRRIWEETVQEGFQKGGEELTLRVTILRNIIHFVHDYVST